LGQILSVRKDLLPLTCDENFAGDQIFRENLFIDFSQKNLMGSADDLQAGFIADDHILIAAFNHVKAAQMHFLFNPVQPNLSVHPVHRTADHTACAGGFGAEKLINPAICIFSCRCALHTCNLQQQG